MEQSSVLWNGTFIGNATEWSRKSINPSSYDDKSNAFANFKVTLHDWVLCGVFLVIMSIGILGNCLVIYVFGFTRRKKTKTTELLIIYLAFVDLMASLFNPPLYIYWTLNRYRWDFGMVGCKVIPAIGPIMTTTSGMILLVFALERYIAIVLPFYGKFNTKIVTVICILSTLLSISMYAHYINGLTISNNSCYVPKSLAPDYAYPDCIFIVIRMIMFLGIFITTNIQIFLTLKGNNRTLTQDRFRRNRSRQSKRIIRILLVMGIVFFILVFPRELLVLVFNLSWMIGSNRGIPLSKGLLLVNSWLKVAHTSNSCANVFIYAHMQTIYRRHIMKFLYYITCNKYKENIPSNTNYMSSTDATVCTTPNLNHNASRRSVTKEKYSHSSNRSDTAPKDLPTRVFFHRAQRSKIMTKGVRYDPIYL